MSDDYSADILTGGSVAVGGTATGDIETARDYDWFAVELVAGRTYVIDLEGADTGGGTLANTVLRRLYDADGNEIADTRDDNGGTGRNASLTFTATETATHYIEARGKIRKTGTYTVQVTDATPDLGDITGQSAPGSESLSLDGTADAVEYRRFTLTEEKAVELELLGLDADADLVLEDAEGNELDASRESGTTGETLSATLAAGTYYVRVEAKASGANAFELNYEVSEVEAPPTVVTYTPEQLTSLGLSSSDDDYASDTGTEGVVAVGGSVNGEIEERGDRDWFAVTLEAGRTYLVRLNGYWTDDGTLRDPYLHGIHDSDGNLIAGTSDDNDGIVDNSYLRFTPEASGVHYIAAGASGNQTGTYKLLVRADDFVAGTATTGAVAVGGAATGRIDWFGDQDWFAVTLEADRTYQLDLKGERSGDGTLDDPGLRGIHDAEGVLVADTTDRNSGFMVNSRVTFTPTGGGTYYVAAGSDYGTGTYTLAVADVTDGYPYDDYAADTATEGTVTVGGTTTGDVEYAGDRDWFAVVLEAGKTYRFDLLGATLGWPTLDGSLSDPLLGGVYDAGGVRQAGTTDDDSGLHDDSRVFFTPDVAGTYYVEATGVGATEGTYTLAVIEVHDDFAADTGTSASVAVGGTASGNIEVAGDEDWFAVELTAGRQYVIGMKGRHTHDGTLDDPYIAGIHDAGGVRLPGTTDAWSGVGWNASVTFAPAEDGTYYVAASSRRDKTGTYEVTVRTPRDDYPINTGTTGTVEVNGSTRGNVQFRYDRDWFAVDLEAGKTYVFELKGSDTGSGTLGDPYLYGIHDAHGTLIGGTSNNNGGTDFNSHVTFTPDAEGTYYVAAGGHFLTGTYELAVTEHVDDFGSDTDTEGEVDVYGSVTGEIEVGYDRDWFAVDLQAGRTYEIVLKGSWTGVGTLDDPYLHGVHDAEGTLIAGSQNDDSGGGPESRVLFTASDNGTYYVAAGAGGNDTGTYTLWVEDYTAWL